MHIRAKTITAIILVILAVSLSYLYFFLQVREDKQRLLLHCKKEMVSSLVAAFTAQTDKLYSARIQSLTTLHREVVRALADRDREKLRQLSQPLFEVLRRENTHFDHLNFLLPDNTVFLNVTEAGGGDEDANCQFREGQRNESLAGTGGFIHCCCGLIYQILRPVELDGRPIGSILIGIRISSFLEDISKTLAMHTALALRAEVVGDPPLGTEPATRSGDYYLYPYGDPFFQERMENISFNGQEQEFIHGDRVHLIFPSFAIKDNDGRELGAILQGIDITDITAAARLDILRLVLITIALLMASSFILYLSFSILYGRLMTLNESLNSKNEELLQAGHQLEDQVAARTSELAAANASLQREIELRHEANQSLSRSIEEWQSTFDAIVDPVTILDKNLEVVIANKAAHDLLSKDEQEIVGRTCHELFAGSPNRCVNCPASEVFSKGVRQEYEVEHDYLGKSLLVSCAPIHDGREIFGYVHTAKDITREKALKKQLAQAQKMEAIATLAGGIAHDFNNILGAILGNADLLLFRLAARPGEEARVRTILTQEEIEAHLQAIKKAGNRAKELVSQILAFSRQGKTLRQNAIIIPVVKEAVKLLRASLPANIEIKTELASDLCHVYADLTQVHQVFMNLCTNAAQAMAGKGGILSVTLRNLEAGAEDRLRYPGLKPGRYAMLAVEDTGHGMSPEVMERIYDPFFTTRDVGEGTGLGLAVIHGIITAHDGLLDVKSQVNVGSTFTVFLPCVTVEGEAGQDIILGMPRGREKILFVDDEEDIVRMTSRMLEYLGYTVYPATSGDQALALLDRESFAVDLVITDYSMPGISGVQLARDVARLRPSLPVMLCSGFSESVVEEGARKYVARFMSKPLDMKKLAVAIREILGPGAGA